MSTPHIVDVKGRPFEVVDDVTISYRVVATGSVTEELSGLPLRVPLEVTVSRPDILPRTADGGLYALAAYVEWAFPKLSLLASAFQISLRAEGHRSATATVNIPVNAVFPVAVPPMALRAMPLRVQGRVVQSAGVHPPIPNALVRATTPGLFSARTPIHFAHAAGTAIRSRTLTSAGAAKVLVADARTSDAQITVDNTAGIVANTLLRLGSDIDAEFVVAAGLAGPGEVRLTGPLSRSFRAGAAVQRHTRGAAGAANTLARSADPGDGLLLCAGALSAPAVEIVDAGATEYAAMGALTDAAGFYALDGIGGAAAVEWTASAFGFTDLPLNFVLDYSQPVNFLDFRL